jgi:hypothetical protein
MSRVTWTHCETKETAAMTATATTGSLAPETIFEALCHKVLGSKEPT